MSDPSLAAFRAGLMADPALLARLAPIWHPERFAGEAIAAAAAMGITLTPGAISAGSRADPLGIGAFGGRPANTLGWPGRGWMPIAIDVTGPELLVDWAHFAGAPLNRPFFEEDVHVARGLPLNRLLRCRTPLAALYEAADAAPIKAPDGLIFHMSRCGSTLVSQMLAADPGTVMLSEPGPLDTVIQIAMMQATAPMQDRIALIRAMVGALGHGGGGDARHLVIKPDSWHAMALPLFRQAFPDTPWIFLYRDPVEVLVSHKRMPGRHVVPGLLDAAFGGPAQDAVPHGDYAAHMLARICTAALDQLAAGGGLPVNYAALPDAVLREILPHFGIHPDDAAATAMAQAMRRDAKAPTAPFTADGAAKQREASAETRAIALDILAEPYRLLGVIRARREG